MTEHLREALHFESLGPSFKVPVPLHNHRDIHR